MPISPLPDPLGSLTSRSTQPGDGDIFEFNAIIAPSGGAKDDGGARDEGGAGGPVPDVPVSVATKQKLSTTTKGPGSVAIAERELFLAVSWKRRFAASIIGGSTLQGTYDALASTTDMHVSVCMQ